MGVDSVAVAEGVRMSLNLDVDMVVVPNRLASMKPNLIIFVKLPTVFQVRLDENFGCKLVLDQND